MKAETTLEFVSKLVGKMYSHTHLLQSLSTCTTLAAPALGARLSRQRCCGTQTVCRASQYPDVALLERPGVKKSQELPRPGSDSSRPAEWLEAKQGDISQHNQVLLSLVHDGAAGIWHPLSPRMALSLR